MTATNSTAAAVTGAALTEQSLISITGAELMLVRDLLKRSHDEHMSRVRDNNLGLNTIDGVIARFVQAHQPSGDNQHAAPHASARAV